MHHLISIHKTAISTTGPSSVYSAPRRISGLTKALWSICARFYLDSQANNFSGERQRLFDLGHHRHNIISLQV